MSEPPLQATARVAAADPGAYFRRHRDATLAAMARVLDGGRYILGAEVDAFEREFAAYLGTGCGVGVANGTDAISLGLRAAGVGAGDRVVTVAHTAGATVHAILAIGATPVLVDVSPDYFTLEKDAVAQAFRTNPPKAVVAVHLYGQAADAKALAAVAAADGAVLLEDCAQAHGAALDGRKVGTFGAVAAFSFYPTKNLGALGDGGLVATASPEIATRLKALREYGWHARHVAETAGGANSRLDELQAAILRERLRDLDAANARRRAIAGAYDRAFAGIGLRPPAVRPGATHVYHQYVIRHPQRDAFRDRVAADGVQTAIHYPVPVHRQVAYFDRCEVPEGGLPQTDLLAREVLSLPIYPELDDAAVERVIDSVRKRA